MANRLTRFFQTPIDWFLLVIPLILTTIGIITIYTITFRENGWELAFDQLTFAVIGLIAMVVLMFTDYRLLLTYSGFFYILSISLLVILLPFIAPSIPFVATVFGATRWIDLGFFQLQPSEIFKLAGIIAAAAFLSKRLKSLSFKSTIGYILLFGIPTLMVFFQPNLGTAVVLAMIFAMIFLSSGPNKKIIIGLLILISIIVPVVYSNLQPYQKTRIETFLNASDDPRGAGYNVNQSLIAVGSGGLYGRGFGQGSQTVLNFLPVPHADFIFAGFSEATGFIGSFTLLFLYVFLLIRVLRIGNISNDHFAKLIAVGIATKLFVQLTIHIGMNLNLMPVTGIPLPFMSYGGTSLIVDLAGIGVLLNIHMRHNKMVFK